MRENMQILEYVGSIIECAISLYFIISFFEYKKIKNRYLFTGIAFVLLVVDNIWLSQKSGYEMLSILLLIAILLVFSLLALEGRVYLKIVMVLIVPMLIMIINMASLYLISTIANVEVMHLYNVNHEARFLLMFLSKFIYFFITRKGIEIFKMKENQLGNAEWLLIVLLFSISFAIMMIFWKESITRKLSPNLYISILICLTIMNILVYWMMKTINRLQAEKTELALNAFIYEARSKNIETIKNQYDEIRGIKHDMKNYLLSVSMLLKQNKIEDAKILLEDVTKNSVENMKLQLITNNEVVDAILNSKINMCHKKDIKIDYIIEKDCVQIDHKDAGILLANLLDNAIEAEDKLKDNRNIKCTMNHYKKYLKIVIENQIEESILESNPKLKTTKANKKNHGYGVRTVKRIVEKYNGMINLSEENNVFKVEVLLMQ